MVKSKRPIQFQLSGRLGNQLFQLAYAHKLAHQFDRKVQLTTDSIHFPSSPGYDLVTAQFCCSHVMKPTQRNLVGHIVRVLDKLNTGRFGYLAQQILPILKIHRQLDSHIAGAEIRGTPWLVTGFYIDTKWVELNESVLHEEITALVEQMCSSSSLLDELKKLGDFQMMHVRRGDYLNNSAEFGILTPNYYKAQKTNLPIVLSLENTEDLDDLAQILEPRIVLTKDNSTAWEALYAMSQASDLVMSNSTFSWWGGFLATNTGGVARMPSPYFKRSKNVDRFFEYRFFSNVESDFIDG